MENLSEQLAFMVLKSDNVPLLDCTTCMPPSLRPLALQAQFPSMPQDSVLVLEQEDLYTFVTPDTVDCYSDHLPSPFHAHRTLVVSALLKQTNLTQLVLHRRWLPGPRQEDLKVLIAMFKCLTALQSLGINGAGHRASTECELWEHASTSLLVLSSLSIGGGRQQFVDERKLFGFFVILRTMSCLTELALCGASDAGEYCSELETRNLGEFCTDARPRHVQLCNVLSFAGVGQLLTLTALTLRKFIAMPQWTVSDDAGYYTVQAWANDFARFTSSLGSAIQKLCLLQRLILDDTISCRFGIAPVMAGVQVLTQLTCLVLSAPKDVGDGYDEDDLGESLCSAHSIEKLHIATMLRKLRNLVSLDLVRYDADSDVFFVMSSLTHLTRLCWEAVPLPRDQVSYRCEAIGMLKVSRLVHLESLILRQAQLSVGVLDLGGLVEELTYQQSLSRLELVWCGEPVNANDMNSSSESHADSDNESRQVSGVDKFAEHLRMLTSLTKLSLEGTPIGPERSEALAGSLVGLVKLKQLNVAGCQLGQQGEEKVRGALQSCFGSDWKKCVQLEGTLPASDDN